MTLPLFLLYQGLTLLASLSPLLTFTSLWQTKEWRFDRLREHMRSQGVFRQLFGLVRPAIVLPFFLLDLMGVLPEDVWPFLVLILLSIVTVAQIGLRRQPMPIWTQKAICHVGLTLVLTSLYLSLLYRDFTGGIGLLPLLQPFLLVMSWVFLRPLDWWLKHRILTRAKTLRENHPDLTVIGITGSVGKTTTKELLAHVLADEGVIVTPAHVNAEIGVAQWFSKTISEAKKPPHLAIIEMGAYRMGEIATLCRVLKPRLGVVTFVGKQHIALFGSQEALCRAKGELFASLPKDGHAFLNADNALCAGLADRAQCDITSVGTGGHANVEAFEIEEIPKGLRFRVEDTVYTVPLHGTHNVTNVLLTIAVALHLEKTPAHIAQKLRSFRSPEHTFRVLQQRGVTILDDTHNASAESFTAAINWAKSQPVKNRTLLTSGLIELGEEQDRTHVELGTLSANVFERVIFTDKYSGRVFSQGFGKPVELLEAETPPVEKESLLVCEGRIPPSVIQRLLQDK